jgi:hypothetical protein
MSARPRVGCSACDPARFALQGLYSCRPFRERLLQYASANGGARATEDNILTALAELFVQVGAVLRLPVLTSG